LTVKKVRLRKDNLFFSFLLFLLIKNISRGNSKQTSKKIPDYPRGYDNARRSGAGFLLPRSSFYPSQANPFVGNERFITARASARVAKRDGPCAAQQMGNVGVASRKPEPAPFRDVAAWRGSVARRR